ncbi:GAF domain-containing protein [Actinomycetospora sp.]|uniref:GAF domain-containing protein n=1 Tax=Actinomycetospora sp. TaxID=1872135 RepID=UPI002F428B4F
MSLALAEAVDAGEPDAALAVCRACVDWLPMTGASITIISELQGAQELLCATDAGAARIDELQFSLGDGPCVESFRTGRAVLVADITDPGDTRWPVFAGAVAETGARGMFAFPLHVGAAKIGVLECYRDRPGSLSAGELSGALRAADAAMWTLLERPDPRGIAGRDPGSTDTGTTGWLDGSVLPRAEVHQATGVLIAQAGLDAPAALARLRAIAFRTGRRIGEVAEDVLAHRLRLDPGGAWYPVSGVGSENVDPTDEDPRPPGQEGNPS